MLNKIGSATVMGLISLLGLSSILYMHSELKVAENNIRRLETTLTVQKALSESMSNISVAAIKQKSESENEKTETKYVVRNIIQASECASVDIPVDAVNRLRQYSENIRSATSTN